MVEGWDLMEFNGLLALDNTVHLERLMAEAVPNLAPHLASNVTEK